ncbi:YdiK family protein [Priestia endophytica]|uniref:YdiK family protein n=1 Tax=Priestia endophytica TaxID=135735 RepID=UPI000DCA849A|nr:YdiK family protein [Priestia endophytica]RAS83187.1 DUF4305 domain-containing protein [Priestia endophytica]
MRTTPLNLGIMYGFLGIIFTFLAIRNAHETIFNFMTIVFTIFATLEIGVAIRAFILHFRIKKMKKKQ